jgi:DNA sulfur modification protein DndB
VDDFDDAIVFPAIRGVQAGREYYVSQCRLRLIPRLFQFDEGDLPAEVRAQRGLNRSRVPEIAEYMLSNQDSYVFSALTASIDCDVRFEPLTNAGESGRLGLLRIPMEARFVINDGQHRRAAIEMAIEREPSLGDETIAIVFFLDRGLERSQQMFADLNRYAIRPAASLNVLYDHRDPWSNLAKSVVAGSWRLKDLVEKERTSLSARSRKLFTLSAIRGATSALLHGFDDLAFEERVATAIDFWDGTAEAFPEWQQVQNGKVVAGDVRTDFIHTYGTILHALGRVGNAVLASTEHPEWKQVGARLAEIDWAKSNTAMWEGRAMTAGHVVKANQNVTLTTNAIKKHLGLVLSPEEQRVEDAFTKAGRKR